MSTIIPCTPSIAQGVQGIIVVGFGRGCLACRAGCGGWFVLSDPGWCCSGDNFGLFGNCEVGAVDDGFFSDVSALCGVCDVKSCAALVFVEVVPDDGFIVVGQYPGVGGGGEGFSEGFVGFVVKCSEVEFVALDNVGGVGVEEEVGAVFLEAGDEVESVELCDGDSVSEFGHGFDSLCESVDVVSGVNFPGSRLI